MPQDRATADLDPAIQDLCAEFLAHCRAEGVDAFLTQTYRSAADQDSDYARGRATPGSIITNAKGGESPHNCTLPDGTPAARAFDFAISDGDGTLDWDAADARWQKAILIGEQLGLVSGSTWHSIKDNPHMELPDWRNNPTPISTPA